MKRLLAPLLLVLALVACSDDGDKSDEADDTTTTTVADTTSTTEATTTTSTTAATQPDAQDIALTWVAAIAAGDDAQAIALTSPRSMEEIGGEDGWHALEIELAEGWGAWGNTPDAEVVVEEITDGVWAATFHGEVAQEGPPEESWSTLVVVDTEDGPRVEPFLDLGNVELDPESGASIEASHRFSAYVLAGREVAILVDGKKVVWEVEGADGDQQHVFADVAITEPGLVGFSVIVWNDTGVMARSAVYTVS